ncbi:MAG: hypothetical protein JWP03_4615 [Phycisphaerales bacterium]|nr:hypothetical protein [Phycisphaerales bacterium]
MGTLRIGPRVRRAKLRKPALRRICTPLLGLGMALPHIAFAQAVAPPPPPPAARPNVTPELKGRTVDEVRILGNTTVPTPLISKLIRTKPGDKFDPATVQEDYQRIFDMKKFSNVQSRVEPTAAGGVIVVFDVAEQKLIRSISFRGNHAIQTESLKSATDLQEGQAIDSFRIALARQAIVNQYHDQEYPYANVDYSADALSQRGDLIFNIIEGPQVRIRKVDFIGARSFDKDKLNGEVKTASYIFIFRPGKLDPEQIDEDIAALHRFYENHGFFDVRVGRKLIFSPDNSEVEVDFVIDEGRRYTVRKVNFEGNAHLGEAALRQGLKLAPGMPWDDETLQRDVKQIVKDYSPFGYIYQPGSTDEDYLRIEHKPVFLKESGQVDLVYDIHEGKPFRMGPIHVKGNTNSQDKLVKREFRDLVPGGLYDSGGVQDAIERLRARPYFSAVTVTPVGDDPNYRDLLVEVTEARTASFNVGAGINSNGGVGGNITYRQTNFDITNAPNDIRDAFAGGSFTGAGQQLVASFEPGTVATNASISFTEPYLFDQPYSFSNDLYLRDRLREHYDDRREGDSITFGKRFNYVWSAGLSLRAEDVKIGHIEDDKYRSEQILAAQGNHFLTGAGISVRRDTTNPGIFPYQGSVLKFGYEYVGALGGDYRFHKLSLSGDAYQTIYEDLIDRRTVLGFHGFAGYIPGNSVFFERFYGGGIGSIRGFRFRGVSPREGRGSDPIGGNFALTGSAEVNFPIYGETLRGVVFTDVGDIESGVRLGTIRSSVGAGVRLTLPFLGQAPLAIDFAVPITKSGEDDKQLISFSLGFSQ